MTETFNKMKILTRYINFPITTVLLFFLTELLSFSQETVSADTIRGKLYAGISFGLTKNTLIPGSSTKLDGLTSTGSNSFHILLETGYFFSKHFGLSTGIGYETYRNELSLNSFADSFPSVDIDNEEYDRRVSASELQEYQDISMINIPVSVNCNIPFFKRAGFFLSAGMILGVPVIKNYNSNGTYTFTGYYSSYNVIFHDLPEYGFPSNTASSAEGSLELAPYIIYATGGAGIQYSLNTNFQIALGVNYKRSLTGIIESHAPEAFRLSSDINQINSMINGLTGSRIETIDLRISLRYYFKK
jgi:hypothetical protein